MVKTVVADTSATVQLGVALASCAGKVTSTITSVTGVVACDTVSVVIHILLWIVADALTESI